MSDALKAVLSVFLWGFVLTGVIQAYQANSSDLEWLITLAIIGPVGYGAAKLWPYGNKGAK